MVSTLARNHWQLLIVLVLSRPICYFTDIRKRRLFQQIACVTSSALSPSLSPHFSIFFLSFEYKYISHLNGDEKWCKLAALDWASEQQERGVRGASGRRWAGKIAQAATYSFAFPSPAKWTRTWCVFCAQFIQGNQHLHYTYNMQMNANLLAPKINLGLPVCVFSRAPVKHSDVWANYRWTSHVHSYKDISEPVSSLQPFIKHWQFSTIIITGSEKTWLNRI